MAASKGPRHDFAPAWLKIPDQDNYRNNRPSDSSRPLRSSRREEFDYASTGYDRRGPNHSYRHHSVDDEGYGPYGNNMGIRFQGQPSLPRDGGRFAHSGQRYNQHMNGYGSNGQFFYDPYLDPYYNGGCEPYYGGGGGQYVRPNCGGMGKRPFNDKVRSTSRGGEPNRSRERSLPAHRSHMLDEEFPSLNGDAEHTANRVANTAGDWEKPLKPKTNIEDIKSLDGQDPTKNSSSGNLYKAILTHKKTNNAMRVNGPLSTNGNGNGGVTTLRGSTRPVASRNGPLTKEGRKSPTPPIELLETCMVTQPKNLGDKKSSFLRTLKRESNRETSAAAGEPKAESTVDTCIKAVVEEEQEPIITNGIPCPQISKHDQEDSISTSLEKEHSLLRQMGWDEDDTEDYVITDEEIEDIRMKIKMLKEQNGSSVMNGNHRRALPRIGSISLREVSLTNKP